MDVNLQFEETENLRTIRVWKMHDCDYVAAESVFEAIEFYELHVPLKEGQARKFDLIYLTVMLSNPQVDSGYWSLKNKIWEMQMAGDPFPAFIEIADHFEF
jgi:hypothetical protein